MWGQLQQHTVESSEVVKYSRRSGMLLFDRGKNGEWFFASAMPEELRQLRRELRPADDEAGRRDYDMSRSISPTATRISSRVFALVCMPVTMQGRSSRTASKTASSCEPRAPP